MTLELKSKGMSDPIWQRSFYDRVIRNERELRNIRIYIRNNPLKESIDSNVPINLEI